MKAFMNVINTFINVRNAFINVVNTFINEMNAFMNVMNTFITVWNAFINVWNAFRFVINAFINKWNAFHLDGIAFLCGGRTRETLRKVRKNNFFTLMARGAVCPPALSGPQRAGDSKIPLANTGKAPAETARRSVPTANPVPRGGKVVRARGLFIPGGG